MAQEEHSQRCSNSSSGGGDGGGGDGCGGGSSSSRSSKKMKQKVPQRGLGVAQLEKIRLEEQQKKDVAISSPNPLVSPSNSSSNVRYNSSPNFRYNPSPSLIPLPPPLPTDLSLSNPIFRPEFSIPTIEFLHPSSVSLSKPSNGDGGEIGWPSILGLGQGNLPKFGNGDYNLEGENHRLDHQRLAFGSNVNLPFDSNPIWPPPNAIQWAHQFQQQPSSLSMVNVSSGTSSSSGINYHQIEPPSNQSFYGNNTPVLTEEERMVGRKRSYPFSLDNPPGISFPCKYPPTYVSPINRSDESPSCGNGGTVNVELSNSIFSSSTRLKEGPSSSSFFSELNNPKKVTKENGDLNGDFLTLAPPKTTVPHPSPKLKLFSISQPSNSQELPDFASLPFQGSVEDIHRPGPNRSTQQQPFYSFYPTAKARIGQVATPVSGCSRGENLDLNLKL